MPTNLVPDIKDLGEFSVARVLPNPKKKMVGPFIFFDHMGPVHFAAGEGVNVRPHPHIGLATLTYLLDGNILHRDSLGNCQEIVAGDVNWMVSGRGITHSERESHEVHSRQHSLDGMQCWVALPREHAEIEPSFTNLKRNQLPHRVYDGVSARLVIGEAYGMSAPIKVFSPMFLLDLAVQADKKVERPNPDQECLMYLANGAATVNGVTINQGDTVLLESDEDIHITTYSRIILMGGEAWNEVPHLYWNFVAFDKDRLEQAKSDWRAEKFATIPGDDYEFIPLPD